MTKIKLKEWADRHNLSYLTANRHFHAGMIPGATQLDSGTILVEDDSLEQNMTASGTNDAMSLFLKKTVEFSKNNSTVEDFAAYVISNFQLKLNSVGVDSPRYSKHRPKPEEVQKHFQQFLPDKEKTEQLKAITSLIKQQGHNGEGTFSAEDLGERFTGEPKPITRVVDTVTNGMDAEWDSIGADLLANAPQTSGVRMYSPEVATEGLVTRSVDFDTTPQQINYTGSTSQTFSSGTPSASGAFLVSTNSCMPVSTSEIGSLYAQPAVASLNLSDSRGSGAFYNSVAAPPFQPTQKELLSAAKVIEAVEIDDLSETDSFPRKRGRKPSKKR
jgi:hypothetical protein